MHITVIEVLFDKATSYVILNGEILKAFSLESGVIRDV